MLEVHTVPVTPFQQNATVLVCSETRCAVVVDAGDSEPLLRKIEALGVTVEAVLATHGHLDHIGGTAELLEHLGVPFFYPSGDVDWLESLPQQATQFGLPQVAVPEVAGDLVHGQILKVGEVELEVRHCPGHTRGHIVLVDHATPCAVVGDVLFAGSIGRTDFPGGSFEQLEHSIREQLYGLPGETVVYCGHGPETTIAQERATNPFVRAHD